jgi:hypothetical protein
VTFPWIYVLQPELVHALYFFSFLSSSPSSGDFNRFKILCSFLDRKYISHVHLPDFLLSPPSPISDLPSCDLCFTVWLHSYCDLSHIRESMRERVDMDAMCVCYSAGKTPVSTLALWVWGARRQIR